ncbi:D-alanyl-D-alanine carboxypeptidase family protein [Desulfallas thermosapovorans]|uniref:serine-type D-Ala-D-Ala carboxypeptidase n=1 Tax=Desulfallas thermosapovorans DSM 6562 TaxID=1121431 RepID=A0A5S4ZTS2_9FIRM|nr:D-alanyl-D-alanine carboxypeptidase family protein [Desulfallas thermosapovorans]TYO95593.1 D-alanyl-D-alanine carboxypeptidase (penicillin-binding protein 5/6) [Desulfallas thermosapovorans DSM 6562]
MKNRYWGVIITVVLLLLTVQAGLALAAVDAQLPAAAPVNEAQAVTGDGTGAEKTSAEAAAAALETTAEAAVLMDAATGKVLWAKEQDKSLPMASVTKIMTLLLACEALEQGKISLDDRVTVSENAWSMGGSQIYLEPGEEMSMHDMLISVAVGSANDASVAVAEHIAGSEEAFVEMMNKRAAELGCKHTRFANPTGLPAENHYTSAYDMAVIMRQALTHPHFIKISSIYRYDIRGGDFVLWNTNKLLKWYQGVDAGKTGWTNEAKYCLAATAKRDGLRLISVVLGTPEPRSHFRETMKIFNYGFARYEAVQFAQRGERVKNIKVGKGTIDQVGVVAGADIAMAVPKGQKENYRGKALLPEEITAPVKKGQRLGDFVVLEGEKEVLRVPLLAQNQVSRALLLRQMHKALDHVF